MPDHVGGGNGDMTSAANAEQQGASKMADARETIRASGTGSDGESRQDTLGRDNGSNCVVDCDLSREHADIVVIVPMVKKCLDTVSDKNESVTSGGGSGGLGPDFPELANGNADWLRVVGPDPACPITDDLVCTLWVIDQNGGSINERSIDVFNACIQGICDCVYDIMGAPAQLKPCRIFAEAMCRGDTDPDWEYVLRGVCFGYRVIDSECDSSYDQANYSSITRGDIGKAMTARLEAEIEGGLLTVVEKQCKCTHPLGSVPKGQDDFRAIVDCSSPSGVCVNDYTTNCRTNFSYNSVESVTKVLQVGDFMATIDISNAYRAVNIHPDSRERQGLSWEFGNNMSLKGQSPDFNMFSFGD